MFNKYFKNLTDIKQYLTDTIKSVLLVISFKYWFTQISTLVIFYQYLTDSNQYILETKIIGKIG